MDYIPKKDWVSGQKLMHTDMNRIEAGIEESFFANVGEKGEQGIQGVQGLQGERGDNGEKGDKGDVGLQGLQGIAGSQGIRGEKGDTGEKGETGDRGIRGVAGFPGLQGVQGDKGETGEGVVVTTESVTISSALSTRGGTLASQNLQKQGIFTKLSLSFFSGNTIQTTGTRLTIGTLPTGFRPTQTVHTFASDTEGSDYPRHAILIESNGNVIWIPNTTGWFTMNFQVVF